MRKPRSTCAECPSRMKGLCGALAEGDLCRLGSVSWHRRFRPGDVIHVEGEVPPSFCAIVKGVVKLMKSLPNGSQQIVGLFGAGDFLGRPFGGEARATAIAALTAQPPLMMRNWSVMHLPPGGGNCATRNTMS